MLLSVFTPSTNTTTPKNCLIKMKSRFFPVKRSRKGQPTPARPENSPLTFWWLLSQEWIRGVYHSLNIPRLSWENLCIQINILPRFLDLFHRIPVFLPTSFFRLVDQLLSSFLWGNKHPRIRKIFLQRHRQNFNLMDFSLYSPICKSLSPNQIRSCLCPVAESRIK